MNIFLSLNLRKKMNLGNFLPLFIKLITKQNIIKIKFVIKTEENDLNFFMNNMQYFYSIFNVYNTSYEKKLDIYYSNFWNKHLFEKEKDNFYNLQHENSSNFLNLKNYELNLTGEKLEINKLIKEYNDLQNSNYNINLGNYEKSALGGTFNLLHSGHKLLLSLSALSTSKSIKIGITGNELLVNKSNKNYIESYRARKKQVNDFLNYFNKDLDYEIFQINNGMDGWDGNYNVLVVSKETEKAINIFNKKRKENNLKKIDGLVLNIFGKKINQKKFGSSTIREYLGEKLSYENFEFLKKKLFFAFEIFSKKIKDDAYKIDLELFFFEFILLYSQNHRYYHTTTHVIDCLKKFEKYFEKDLKAKEKTIIILSLMYHDIIYSNESSENEYLSSIYFKNFMKKLNILPKEIIEKVSEIILATKTHKINKTNKLQSIVNDIDMSILAEEKYTYKEYFKNIRKEFCIYDDQKFKKGRLEFLESLLKKKNLEIYYHHNIFCHEKVKENILSEIKYLKN